MKYKRLYAEMFVKGITKKDIAVLLNKSVGTIGSRLRGDSDFTYKEAIAIMHTYFKGYSADYIFSMGEYTNEEGECKSEQ